MTPVEFFLGVLVGVVSICLIKGWWTFCNVIKEKLAFVPDGESEIRVKCDVCGWSVTALFSEEQEFPVECHNCGSNSVEPVEAGEDE